MENGIRNEYSCRYLEGSGKVGVSLMVDATNQCQLKCRYCYYGEKGTVHMSTSKVFAATQNMAALFGDKLKDVNIHYMGGEPLVAWNQILDLNEKSKAHFAKLGIPFRWSLTSNLVGLTEKRAEHMIREKAGIHCSIDGPADIHNRNRPFRSGKDSFAKVVKAIPLALQITPNDTARVTVCPEDAHRMPEIAHEILDRGFKTVGLFPAHMDGWGDEAFKGWQEGIAGAFDLVAKKYGREKRVSTIVRETPRGVQKNGFSYCGAGKGLWAIGVDGKLYFCHHMTNHHELAIVDASTASVEEIRRAIEGSPVPPRTNLPQDVCTQCPALFFCNGGCWSDNFLASGSSIAHEPSDCRLKVATVEAIGERMLIDPPKKREVIGDQKQEGELKAWCILYNNCDCDGCDGGCQGSCQGPVDGCPGCDVGEGW